MPTLLQEYFGENLDQLKNVDLQNHLSLILFKEKTVVHMSVEQKIALARARRKQQKLTFYVSLEMLSISLWLKIFLYEIIKIFLYDIDIYQISKIIVYLDLNSLIYMYIHVRILLECLRAEYKLDIDLLQMEKCSWVLFQLCAKITS